MPARLFRFVPVAGLALVGCFHLPARVCLTPPYDAPAGFSETYHAALAAREPLLRPGVAPLPPTGMVAGPPVLILPPGSNGVEPPMEW